MESTPPVPAIPRFIARRRWWLVPLLAWAGLVATSLDAHLDDAHQQSVDIAVEGARNMFDMVVITRAWNAEHGGVYLPVSDKLQPNPYLDHPHRDVTTTDGQHLTLVNPAFMTRLISEMANRQSGATFHITSLRPMRPENAADAWERIALSSFEAGQREATTIVPVAGVREGALRYMAPLKVNAGCLPCHARQGYREGDIRGGISVTQPFAPIAAAMQPARRQSILNHLLIFTLGAVGGGLLLELLRRRWLHLDQTIGALRDAHRRLDASNHALGEARDAAEAASQAKTRFLANLSHEFRTPLNAIAGFTHLLKRKVDDPQAQVQVGKIQQASDKLLTMIDQLLKLTRAETGQLDTRPEPCVLGDFVAQRLAHLHDLIGERPLNACLHFEPADNPGCVTVDHIHLAQIVDQFLDNAVKFSSAGDISLTIACQQDATGHWRLNCTVDDQGEGISAAELPTLFTLFHQVDASTTRTHSGNGIGLILCKRLAEVLGGEVGAESNAGQGSRFWVEVPVSVC